MGISGARFGFADQPLLLSGVDQDATSKVYRPSTSAQVAIVQAAAGVSTGGVVEIWTMQDASGALVGANGINLAAGGTAAAYRQAIPGQSSLGVSGSDGVTTTFSSTNAALPDPTTTSYLILLYVYVASTPAAQRVWFQYGTTLPQFAVVGLASGVPVLRFQSGLSLNGSHNVTGAMRPIWIQYYVTSNSIGPRGVCTSDQDFLSTTKRASVSKNLILTLNFPGVISYGLLISGTQALLSNGQIKAMDSALGFPTLW